MLSKLLAWLIHFISPTTKPETRLVLRPAKVTHPRRANEVDLTPEQQAQGPVAGVKLGEDRDEIALPALSDLPAKVEEEADVPEFEPSPESDDLPDDKFTALRRKPMVMMAKFPEWYLHAR